MSGSSVMPVTHATSGPLPNHTMAAQGALGQDMGTSMHEFQVFNIAITTLALAVLLVTGVICSMSLLRRWRQSKQARIYESAVGGFETPSYPTSSFDLAPSSSSSALTDASVSTSSPIPPPPSSSSSSSGLVLLLRRREGHCSLRRPQLALSFLRRVRSRGRRRETPKDNSRIYYIYSNPLPVGKEEEEQRDANSEWVGLRDREEQQREERNEEKKEENEEQHVGKSVVTTVVDIEEAWEAFSMSPGNEGGVERRTWKAGDGGWKGEEDLGGGEERLSRMDQVGGGQLDPEAKRGGRMDEGVGEGSGGVDQQEERKEEGVEVGELVALYEFGQEVNSSLTVLNTETFYMQL